MVHFLDDYPLRAAAREGHTEIVRILLDKGANIHAANDGALRLASQNNHSDTVSLLLERGANREVRQPPQPPQQQQEQNRDDDEFQADFVDPPVHPEVVATERLQIEKCVEKASEVQARVDKMLFERQRDREKTFPTVFEKVMNQRKSIAAVNLPYPIPKMPEYDRWYIYSVYAVCYAPNCLEPETACFNRIYEIVSAPTWEWAIFLALMCHFDRSTFALSSREDRPWIEPWEVKIPILTDVLAQVVNLQKGHVNRAHCIGRCIKPSSDIENGKDCLLRHLVLPVQVFEGDAIQKNEWMGQRFDELYELFMDGFDTNSSEQLECPICTFPLEAAKFTLLQRISLYFSHPQRDVIDMSITNAVPNSKQSIRKIYDEIKQVIYRAGEPKNMPVKLFTCTHKFHVGCISNMYCNDVKNGKNPVCPMCRAPMIVLPVPNATVYYPTSIPF